MSSWSWNCHYLIPWRTCLPHIKWGKSNIK